MKQVSCFALGGYTLVELLVVMTILSLIGLTSFINLGNFREDKLLDTSLTNLQSLIRTAQSNASTGVLCSGVGGAIWSIEFIKDSKTINLKCQASSQTATVSIPATSLVGDVQVKSISSGSSCSSDTVTVNFLPVSGGTTFTDLINTCIGPSQSLTVTLYLSGKIETRTVTINKGGSIN